MNNGIFIDHDIYGEKFKFHLLLSHLLWTIFSVQRSLR